MSFKVGDKVFLTDQTLKQYRVINPKLRKKVYTVSEKITNFYYLRGTDDEPFRESELIAAEPELFHNQLEKLIE